MRRDLTIKTGGLSGTSDFRVLAPIKKGFVPSLDAITYKTRVKRVLRTLHIGRSDAHEHELFRVLSDAVERVGRIHSVGIAVLEPEDKVLLTVTFDGSWEAYVRVIWQKVARLLDLIFCNTDGYVLGYENTYEDWGAWLKSAQSEAAFLYATPNVTVDDIRYLRMEERVHRREPGARAELVTSRIRIPSAEQIASRSIFETDGMVPGDPTSAGYEQAMSIDDAGRPPFRHGVRILAGIYRLTDVFPPYTKDGEVLHRAAQELLPEFVRMVRDGNTYQYGVARALRRFEEAVHWFQESPAEPDVRTQLPTPLPEKPPLADPANVQGGILTSYPDVDHGCLLMVQFKTPAAAAAFLKALPVTTEADTLAPGGIATNIAFTLEGLRAIGLTDDEIREWPEEFAQGMEMRAGILGDVRVNHPQRWRRPARNWALGVNAPNVGETDETARIDLSAVHAMVQVRSRATLDGSDDDTIKARAPLMAALEKLVAVHEGVAPLSLQWMHRLRNANKVVEEHFGFMEGNSEPVLNKADAGRRYSNQSHLGDFLCGYPNLADKTDFYGGASERIRPLMKDGSFLAVRKLRQDVEAFETALAEGAKALNAEGLTLSREDLMAKMMGRWPADHAQSGQPLAEVLGPDPLSNDFHFDKDPAGSVCPFHAHIRRANPRFVSPEPGARPPRIARRGMSYGPIHDRGQTDPTALRNSLDTERGLVFMVYNASLGEQFEVVQSWLSGGNSSGSFSGQSDPLLGVAEPGKKRFFRFEHEGQVAHMPLDGSDRLHVEPRPFVRLEWGAYLFAPSIKALGLLQARAEAQGQKPLVTWSAARGEKKIAALRALEAREGADAALSAWKAALEDQDAAADFTSASIWAAIRENHGGVLRTPYGVLVAEKEMVQKVFVDAARNLTITGYLPRMRRSFGVLYLGLDPGQEDRAYERASEACNKAIMAIDTHYTFDLARTSVQKALQKLVDDEIAYARHDGERRWELTVEARELLEPILADFCEEWFGLSEQGGLFRRAGYRWDWKPGLPPNYPGHFLSPSRYIFQPHPGPDVEAIGAAHGVSVHGAMVDYLTKYGASLKASVTRAVLDSAEGKDVEFASRTIAGAMMGFIPTVEGNLRRILNEWLREGVLWKLRARFAGDPTDDFTDACNRLGDDFIPAMQLRAVPEIIWRTATVSHTLGDGEHMVEVKPGEIVVASSVSATQQCLAEGSRQYHHAFGGNRRAADHPTHACPGADPALAVMLGFFSALVESDLPLRPGPGPLTISMEGWLPAAPPKHTPAKTSDHWLGLTSAPVTTPILVIGDSWLSNTFGYQSLVGSLATLGYKVGSGMRFSALGMRLKEMADPALLDQVSSFFLNLGPHDAKPDCILLGGGGNDVVYPSSEPQKTPLYRMLKQAPAPGEDPLIAEEVVKFIDVELYGYMKTVVDALKKVTDLPIVIHAYDHPIPDGRPLLFSTPWLKPAFDARGMPDLNENREVMRRLIDRLNDAAGRVAAANIGRVHHANLTGILAKDPRYQADYTQLWANELHPTRDGFDLLAAEIARMLQDLNIGPPTS